VMCLDGRWHLNCVIDVRSRKMCVLLTPTASADGTARLLIKAISMMGMPEAVKSDWGKEYQNERIERGSRRTGFFMVDAVARPYSGELKPFVERGQETILHNCCEQIDGYAGHSVVEAAQIRARNSFEGRHGRDLIKQYNIKHYASEVQDWFDRWLNAVYGNNPHAGLHGSTPNAEFAAGEARGEVRRVADERQLDVLFGENGVATVSSKGLRIQRAQFWSDDLIPWVGRRVEWIRTRDAGKLIIYSDEEHPQSSPSPKI
jgi:putative transposase